MRPFQFTRADDAKAAILAHQADGCRISPAAPRSST